MSKYDPITTYLESVPLETQELLLSFRELESILGTTLPNTAMVDRTWWANTRGSNHGSKWLKAGWKVARVDLAREEVIYAREGGDFAKRYRSSGGYKRLKIFLGNIPEKQEQLVLSFAELGKIIGRDLPFTALQDRTWWANTKSSPQGVSWVSAGWLVEAVYLPAKKLILRRKGKNTLRRIRKYVSGLVSGTPTLGHPGVQTLSRWIRLCRQVGWYFEGTVLYERSGLGISSINEKALIELEEDYAICKREILHYKQGNLPQPHNNSREE